MSNAQTRSSAATLDHVLLISPWDFCSLPVDACRSLTVFVKRLVSLEGAGIDVLVPRADECPIARQRQPWQAPEAAAGHEIGCRLVLG